MTSREIVSALLNKQIPERMGCYEHWWPETLRDYWPEQGYPKDANPDVHFGYDMTEVAGWFNTEPFLNQTEVLDETDEWQVIRDGRGAALKFWKKKSGTPEHVSFAIDSPETWAKYREPLLETNVERLGDMAGARRALEEARARGQFAVYGNIFVFELLRGTLGDMTFLPALLEEPDWIRDFCQVYLDFYRRHYEILFREAGVPDGFFVFEDFGFTNGLFASPQTLRDVVFPYEKQLVSFFKDYGIPVLLHSCGDVRKGIPLVIEAGFDCLQPMEAKAGCDVVEIAKTYGNQLAYMGNINVVELTTNDPARVEAEVLRKVRALKEMRVPYFFHSDHSIPPNIKLSTYEHALKVFRDNCAY